VIRGASVILLLAATAGAPDNAAPPVRSTAPDSGAVAAPPNPPPPARAPAPDSLAPLVPDSLAAPGAAGHSAASGADSLAAQLARLGARRDGLTGTGRRVLDELIAAAQQMADDGDLDAALLIAADAEQWVEQQGR